MSLKNHIEWLSAELKAWKKDGILSEQQASTILARYTAPDARVSWGAIVFSTIGAVVAGLGVILLFAFNWDVIPKMSKMALILGGLITAHAAGIHLHLKGKRFRGLGEGLCMLGTMLFGGAIWLVAQIYHIDEHYPNGIVLWGIGALLMALAMQSTPQAILAAVLLATWSGVETVGFRTTVISGPLLILLTLLPLAWLKKSRTLLAVVIPAFLISLMIPLLYHYSHLWFVVALFLNLSGTLVGLSILVRHIGGFPKSSGVFGCLGWAIFIILLFLSTFPGLCSEFFCHPDSMGADFRRVYVLTPLAFCIATWAGVFFQRLFSNDKLGDAIGFEIYLVPLTMMTVYADMFFFNGLTDEWLLAIPFNLLFLALAFSMVVRGCRHGLLKPTIFGSIMFVSIMFARYFDLFDNLVARGIVFVVVGAGIFFEGIVFSRARKLKETTDTQ